MLRRTVLALLTLAPVLVLAEAPRSPKPATQSGVLKATPFAKGLQHGWALAMLPDERMLVTERAGRLRIIGKDGTLSEPLGGLPPIAAGGQGGLLDLALSPDFERDSLVYFSFSEAGEGGAGTAVARGKLASTGLEDVRVIWRQTPKVQGPNHWGSRIVFRPDGTLYVTLGDRFSHRDKAQELSNTLGKVVRIDASGRAPRDNPFIERQGAKPEIWSYGHRNIQAAALQPQTGELWTVEHGARGGDELNRPQAGRNYGWPVITYGVDYSGARIGEGRAKAGMEQPVYYWDPVIAPSGAVFYTGEVFKEWQGNLFIGSLQPGALVRIELTDGKVVKEERYLGGERIRDVEQGRDGLLYVLTDSPRGRVLRLDKAR